MNVLIDTSPLKNQSAVRGIGRYTRELVQALRLLPTSHHFFTSEDKAERIQLIHYPYFDFFFATLPFLRPAKTVVTIHDTIPLIFPKHYPRGVKGTLRFLRQKIALKTVAHVITDSHNSKRDIHEHLKVPLDKITPVPLASSPDIVHQHISVVEEMRKKYSIPRKYLLYVGDINYSKNIPFLLRVMKALPAVTLVMVGKQLKNTSIPEGKEIESLLYELNIEERVIRLTDVSDSHELSALYTGAHAYIQPSLYEGFGLPVLEAMQCKTLVVCSLGGSLPEIAGEAAIYFHPHKEDECIQAIKKVLRFTPIQRNALVRKGVERAASYSWERTARETLDIYERIIGSG
jgi:glycosyltransferase involved in cell wall biosynthesis